MRNSDRSMCQSKAGNDHLRLSRLGGRISIVVRSHSKGNACCNPLTYIGPMRITAVVIVHIGAGFERHLPEVTQAVDAFDRFVGGLNCWKQNRD